MRIKIKERKKHMLEREVETIISELLSKWETYFDKNLVLNSEGRKLFSKLIKNLLILHPELRYTIHNLRSNPTLETIYKIIEIFNNLKNNT